MSFQRSKMCPRQEAVWLQVFAQEMQDHEQVVAAAAEADLIASLVPLDTLPCRAVLDAPLSEMETTT